MMVMGFSGQGLSVATCTECGWRSKAHAVPDNAWKAGLKHSC